jgi:hypothetical protein
MALFTVPSRGLGFGGFLAWAIRWAAGGDVGEPGYSLPHHSHIRRAERLRQNGIAVPVPPLLACLLCFHAAVDRLAPLRDML